MNGIHRSAIARLAALWVLAVSALAACASAIDPGGDAEFQAARLSIVPANAQLAGGDTLALHAHAVSANGAERDLTAADGVVWSSSEGAVAAVDPASGVLHALAPGASVVRATLGGASATTTVTVRAPRTLEALQIAPASVTLSVGQTQPFVALGRYRDGTSADVSAMVAWSSSQPAVAVVDGRGVATAGMSAGTTAVTARLDGVESSAATITVREELVGVALSPATLTLHAGDTSPGRLTATATFSTGSTRDVSELATWSVDDATIATVSNTAGQRGAVTVAPTTAGSTLVRASFMGRSSAPATVTVLRAVQITALAITPATASIVAGMEQQLAATATYADGRTELLTAGVTWTSSNVGVATINGTTGLAQGVAAGAATITAAVSDGVTPTGVVRGSAQLAVEPPVLVWIEVAPRVMSIALGNTTTFIAIGAYSDRSTRALRSGVTWTSSMPSVATINPAGVAMGISGGTVTVRATMGTATGTASLFVEGILIRSIAVTPSVARVAPGDSLQLHATATYADGTTQDFTSSCSWSSDDVLAVSVDSTGRATGVTSGASAQIRAMAAGVTGTATVSVGP